MSERVYLDYNATAPLRPEARAAVMAALSLCGNPSSVHADGRSARRLLEDARGKVARLLGAEAAAVVFTGSASEANNLALRGTSAAEVLVSEIEHDSVLQAVPGAKRLPVLGDGTLDLAALAKALEGREAPFLVSVMWANNETGVVQPIAEVGDRVRAAGGLFHCDAVQAAGKLPIDMTELAVDMLTLSAHKMGGPAGVGALVLRPGLDLRPLLRGGGQERGRRAGTENLAGIAGFGAVAESHEDLLGRFNEVAKLRDALEERLLAEDAGVTIYGKKAARLGNCCCFGTSGLKAETMVMALDLAGIAVSAGSACSSGKVGPSHVLRAMGVPEEEAAGAIRVSLGPASISQDLERFLEAWLAVCRRRQVA